MKKPAIVSLSSAQRQEVVNTLDEILKENNYRYKDLVLETLDFQLVAGFKFSNKLALNSCKLRIYRYNCQIRINESVNQIR
jgi:hypothetical protein